MLHWDVICDVGTAIKQTSVADPLTNGGTDAYTEVEWTYLKGDVWTNGSATSFEDRLTGDFDSNDVVIGVKENIDWTTANGGPGSSYLTAKAASTNNAYVDEDVDGFIKLGDIKGELQTTDLRSDNRSVIEPVNLVQGLDAGGVNAAESIELDSSTVDVMNNFTSSLQPANEFI